MPTLIRILPALLLLAACASPPPADPQRASRLALDAEALVAAEDYAGGARLYREALRYAPDEAAYWLRLGDLHEAAGDADAAAASFSSALERLPVDPQRPTLAYRYALLLAGPLQQPAAAAALLPQIPTGVQRTDLEAMLALAGKRPAATLNLLAQALPLATDLDQQARIYYHAALAHERLGNLADSRDALFHAVNAATSPGLKAAIRALFLDLLSREEKN